MRRNTDPAFPLQMVDGDLMQDGLFVGEAERGLTKQEWVASQLLCAMVASRGFAPWDLKPKGASKVSELGKVLVGLALELTNELLSQATPPPPPPPAASDLDNLSDGDPLA